MSSNALVAACGKFDVTYPHICVMAGALHNLSYDSMLVLAKADICATK